MAQPFAPGTLNGVRVLELPGLTGAYCGKLLADLGAEVVKVEPPESDPVRHLAPFKDDQPGAECSLVFLNFAAKKRSAVLPLDTVHGRRQLADLAAAHDVIIASQTAVELEALGLGSGTLSRRAAGAVLVAVTPFGLSGPHAGLPGNDLIAQATGGLVYISGDLLQPPAAAPYYQRNILRRRRPCP